MYTLFDKLFELIKRNVPYAYSLYVLYIIASLSPLLPYYPNSNTPTLSIKNSLSFFWTLGCERAFFVRPEHDSCHFFHFISKHINRSFSFFSLSENISKTFYQKIFIYFQSKNIKNTFFLLEVWIRKYCWG